jgi:hypothetical protein
MDSITIGIKEIILASKNINYCSAVKKIILKTFIFV